MNPSAGKPIRLPITFIFLISCLCGGIASCGENLAPTPGFEENGPWQLVNLFGGSGVIARDDKVARSGQFSMKVVKANDAGRCALLFYSKDFRIPVIADKVCEFGAWVKGKGGRAEFGVQYRDAAMNHAGYDSGGFIQLIDDWQRVSARIRPPQNARFIEIVLSHEGKMVCWWDDLELKITSDLPPELIRLDHSSRPMDELITRDVLIDGEPAWRANWIWASSPGQPRFSAFINHAQWPTTVCGTWGDPSVGYLMSRLAAEGIDKFYWHVCHGGATLYPTSVPGLTPFRVEPAGIDYGDWNAWARAVKDARRGGFTICAFVESPKPSGEILAGICDEVAGYAPDGIILSCCAHNGSPMPVAELESSASAIRGRIAKGIRLGILIPGIRRKDESAGEGAGISGQHVVSRELADAYARIAERLRGEGIIDEVIRSCAEISDAASGMSVMLPSLPDRNALSSILGKARDLGVAEAALPECVSALTKGDIEPFGGFAMPGGRVEFRRELQLDAEPEFAWLSVTADQRYQLEVNGRVISFDTDWWRAETYVITSFLRRGANTIKVEATSPPGGIGAFLAEGVVRYGGNEMRIVSDASWKARWLPIGDELPVRTVGIPGHWPRYRLKPPGMYLVDERKRGNLAGAARGGSAKAMKTAGGGDYAPDKAIDGVLSESSSWHGEGVSNWLEVAFPEERVVRQARLYFGCLSHDGSNCAGCSPKDFRIQALSGGKWADVIQPVRGNPIYTGGDESFCVRFDFRPFKTSALRLFIESAHDDGESQSKPQTPDAKARERVVVVREIELY